jgi:hypothetical protein
MKRTNSKTEETGHFSTTDPQKTETRLEEEEEEKAIKKIMNFVIATM